MDDLLSRISTVLERQDFRMCIPPQSDDTDIVLEECRNAIESLRQQLAAALAACEAKDALFDGFRDNILFRMGINSPYRKELIAPFWERAKEALVIKPDASALKAHDEALIERCICVVRHNTVLTTEQKDTLSAVIRELKETL